MRFNTTKIGVCVVCICLMANGEYNDGTDAGRDCARGQRRIWGDDARHFVAGSEEYGYSTAACDGCGDDHHGDRHEAFVMVPLNKIRTGRDGRMYVSSQDGSHVEVWQGTELTQVIYRDWNGHRRMDYRLTARTAPRARTSMCDVYTPDGVADVVTDVHRDGTVTVGGGERYPMDALTMGSDMLHIARKEGLL